MQKWGHVEFVFQGLGGSLSSTSSRFIHVTTERISSTTRPNNISVCESHVLYPYVHQQTLRLFLCLDCCEQHCNKHTEQMRCDWRTVWDSDLSLVHLVVMRVITGTWVKHRMNTASGEKSDTMCPVPQTSSPNSELYPQIPGAWLLSYRLLFVPTQSWLCIVRKGRSCGPWCCCRRWNERRKEIYATMVWQSQLALFKCFS